MSDPQEVDVVIIGLGPGGEYAANKLAAAGLVVVGVEENLVGGECPFTGCTPSKLLVRAAHTVAETRHAAELAGESALEPDYTVPRRRIVESTHAWSDEAHVEQLEESGVRLVRGRGRLNGPGRVLVTSPEGTEEFVARRGVILGTGTAPASLPIDGLAGTPYLTNREVFRLEDAPGSMIVIGAGNIGCELTQVYARFGTDVTLLDVSDRILSVEEPETSEVLTEVFTREGVTVRTGVEIQRVDHDGDTHQFEVHLDGEVLRAEQLLVAAGRVTQLADLGLETVGLDPEAGEVPVDDTLRAGERLWAVGDITGKGAYTHVALYQAAIAVSDLLGEDPGPADYHAVSRVTFTDPEVGAVGMTEEQARDSGVRVGTSVAEIGRSSRGWMHGPGNDGIIKLVADLDRRVLVGASAMSPYGGEVLGLLALAVHAQIPIETISGMHFAYPTLHRVIQVALDHLD